MLEISKMSSNMVKSRTVILFGREDLLARAIEIFLSNKKEWEVIRISDKHSEKVLIREVDKANPDVVILCQGDSIGQNDLPWRLMQSHPEIKVITIGLENNVMGIYNKKMVLVREVPDLLTVIDS